MKNLNELSKIKLQKLIVERMEHIAYVKGKSVTSITTLTGFSYDFMEYGCIKMCLTTSSMKSLNKYSTEDLVETYLNLGKVVDELDA